MQTFELSYLVTQIGNTAPQVDDRMAVTPVRLHGNVFAAIAGNTSTVVRWPSPPPTSG
jgi:hypothetical protein